MCQIIDRLFENTVGLERMMVGTWSNLDLTEGSTNLRLIYPSSMVGFCQLLGGVGTTDVRETTQHIITYAISPIS